MKNRFLLSSLSLALGAVGFVGLPKIAQACPYKNVSRYTYVYDSSCRCNRMVMVSGFEVDYLNCRTNSGSTSGNGSPSSEAVPQAPTPVSQTQTVAQQYLLQRYQQCVQNGVDEPKCRCAFTNIGQTYTADEIVQAVQEKKAELSIAEGLALLLCPS